jgi:hypothetical protein
MMDLVEDPVLKIVTDEVVQIDVVVTVQLDQLPRLADQRGYVVLGISTEEKIIVTRMLEISNFSKFLDAVIAAHRPNAVVLTRRTKGIALLADDHLPLPLADHALDGVHRQEIGILLTGPLVLQYTAAVELPLGLAVGLGQVLQQRFIPSDDELVPRLAGNEIVLVGKMPVGLGVVGGVDLPLVELSAVVRVEEHEDGGEVAVAVEDVLRGVGRDVDQPGEVLQQHKGGVHVDPAVPDEQAEPH